MRQIYSRSFTVAFSAGDSGYVFAEKIDPGSVLHVHSCLAYSPQRSTTEDIIIGIRNGGQDIILQSKAPIAVEYGAAVDNDFLVGEGDQVFGYFPHAENLDSLGIHLNGVIIPLKEWEAMVE